MIEANVQVKIDGAEHSIRKFGLSDLVALERQYGISSAQFAEGNLKMEWVAFLVHRRLTRGNLIESCPFDDDFLDRIEGVEFKDDEDEAVDPTAPVARLA